MKIKHIPSSWLHRNGRRFDCGPYTSGALEARIRLEDLSYPKQKLSELTAGHEGGIYNGPHFSRTFVDDPKHGVPFLGSGAMLEADLSGLPLLRKRDALSTKLAYLQLSAGMTLISCSGTIGRMVYARPDMETMWTSQHIMKVVPDSKKVPSGYIFAFLSSKFGVPMVTSGTYGSIIQSIEPEHIAGLPVPRLGEAVEREAHDLMEKAAHLRANANSLRANILRQITTELQWATRPLHGLFNVVSSSETQRRMDSFHHTNSCQAARACLGLVPSVRLGDVVSDVFEPNRGARRKVDDPKFGVPFLSSSEVFRLDPSGEYLISRKNTPHLDRQLVGECDVLLPRSGQLGGVIGRAVLPLPTYYGHAASEHLVRVRCHTKEDAFFVWAIFATEPGYFSAISTAFGSSIPSLDCALLSDLRFPWWSGERRQRIVDQVGKMVDGLSTAIVAERKAVALVEKTIEAAS